MHTAKANTANESETLVTAENPQQNTSTVGRRTGSWRGLKGGRIRIAGGSGSKARTEEMVPMRAGRSTQSGS